MRKVFTRTPFNYNGHDLERGEVFDLEGLRNDQKLIDTKYVQEVNKLKDVISCTCGKSFMVESFYHQHLASDRHPKEPIVVSTK